jgi:opacity protein-like surface antigen
MKSILLAAVFAVGTIAAASAQSQMNQTPPNAQRDPSITPATHCMDKATNQPKRRQTTGSGSVAAGNPTAGDKSAKSTGTSSQSPQSPGARGGAMYADLSPC